MSLLTWRQLMERLNERTTIAAGVALTGNRRGRSSNRPMIRINDNRVVRVALLPLVVGWDPRISFRSFRKSWNVATWKWPSRPRGDGGHGPIRSEFPDEILTFVISTFDSPSDANFIQFRQSVEWPIPVPDHNKWRHSRALLSQISLQLSRFRCFTDQNWSTELTFASIQLQFNTFHSFESKFVRQPTAFQIVSPVTWCSTEHCETVETVGDRVTRIPFRLHLIPSGQGSTRQNKSVEKNLKWPVISPRFTAAQPSCEPCPLGESFSQKLNLNFWKKIREIGPSCVIRISVRPVRIEWNSN